VDNAAVGALAAEHLLGRGYERFAFYGLEEVAYSRERGESFVSRVEKGGGKCARLLSPNTFHAGRLGEHELQAVDAWLKHLRRPVGIFAVNDYRAQLLANACRLQALRVPRDVGIVGVDNNHVICEFTSPTLTSVDCDWYQVGYRAAELLDRLMKERGRRRGKMRSEEGAAKTPLEDLLVPPAGIVQRISTDLRVVEDRRLWTSLDYIRDHLGEVFGVERIIAVSGISRRTLEMVFFTELGCSPYHYLCGQRVERAKGLLAAEKEMRLQEISSRCGFHDLRRFREVFRRMEGISPAEFRARPPETGRRQGG
jgi:LacI family transcriptional regulator